MDCMVQKRYYRFCRGEPGGTPPALGFLENLHGDGQGTPDDEPAASACPNIQDDNSWWIIPTQDHLNQELVRDTDDEQPTPELVSIAAAEDTTDAASEDPESESSDEGGSENGMLRSCGEDSDDGICEVCGYQPCKV